MTQKMHINSIILPGFIGELKTKIWCECVRTHTSKRPVSTNEQEKERYVHKKMKGNNIEVKSARPEAL